jgi:hypothetical protein
MLSGAQAAPSFPGAPMDLKGGKAMEDVAARKAEYDAAQVAKEVKRILKRAYPTTKFSVRTDRYAGGSSVDVYWTDGPRQEAVEKLIGHYHGSTFDALTDSTRRHDTVIETAQGPRTIHCGNDHIFTHRKVSRERELVAQAREMIVARCDGITGSGSNAMLGDYWVDSLARAMVCALHFDLDGHTLDDTFREVVLERGLG